MAKHPTMASVARVSEVAADFDALYRTHAPQVRALACHRLGDRAQADDVVQETFLRAYRALDQLDPERPAWPWLRTIAAHICTDIARRSAIVSETPVSHQGHDIAPADEADPNAEAYLGAERRAGIKDALGQVEPRQRRMLMLQVVEGWTPGAVAEAEGMSVTAVRATLKRGRKSFRHHYMTLAVQRGLLGLVAALLARARLGAVRAQRQAARLGGLSLEVALPAGLVSVALAVSGAGVGTPWAAPADLSTTGGGIAVVAPAGAPEGTPEAPLAPAGAGPTGADEGNPTTSWGKSIGATPGPVGVDATAGVEKRDGKRRTYGVVLKDLPGRENDRTEAWVTVQCEGVVGGKACEASDAIPNQ